MADTYVSREELAGRLNLTERQVTNLVKTGVLADGTAFPSRVSGRTRTFPTDRCFDWYIRWKQEEVLGRASPKDIDEARQRYEAARAEMMEMELAEKRGQLLPVDFVAGEWQDMLQALRSFLLSLPSAWADRLGACQSTVDRQLMLEDAIREAMPLLERPAAGPTKAAA